MLETKIGRRDALRGIAIGAWAVGLAILAFTESFTPVPALSPPPINVVVNQTPPRPALPEGRAMAVTAPLKPVRIAYGPKAPRSLRAPTTGGAPDCIASLKTPGDRQPSSS